MTTLLAIDSACAACSVALLREGDLLADLYEEMNRGQAARLVPMVEEVMARAGKRVSDLDAVAVTVGPGAFTGIRIGLATARGLGLASGLPVIGVTTTEAVAASHGDGDHPIVVALETKRSDIYLDVMDAKGQSLQGPMAVPMEEIPARMPETPFILCGDGALRMQEVLDRAGLTYEMKSESGQPQAAWLARIAAEKLTEQGAQAFQERPAPLYLRPPDVAPPKNPVPIG